MNPSDKQKSHRESAEPAWPYSSAALMLFGHADDTTPKLEEAQSSSLYSE